MFIPPSIRMMVLLLRNLFQVFLALVKLTISWLGADHASSQSWHYQLHSFGAWWAGGVFLYVFVPLLDVLTRTTNVSNLWLLISHQTRSFGPILIVEAHVLECPPQISSFFCLMSGSEAAVDASSGSSSHLSEVLDQGGLVHIFLQPLILLIRLLLAKRLLVVESIARRAAPSSSPFSMWIISIFWLLELSLIHFFKRCFRVCWVFKFQIFE